MHRGLNLVFRETSTCKVVGARIRLEIDPRWFLALHNTSGDLWGGFCWHVQTFPPPIPYETPNVVSIWVILSQTSKLITSSDAQFSL